MSVFNRLTAVWLAAMLLAPALPLDARSRKGDQFYRQGKIHEAKKEWDAALDDYKKALEQDPAEMVYQMAVDSARFQAAQAHVEEGLRIRGAGRLGDAFLEFQKAVAINPGSVIAGQELGETQAMILRERKRVEETGHEAPPEIRALTPYEEARREDAERISRILPLPELRPIDPTPFDLHLSGQKAKKIFETIGSLANINVLFDPEYNEPSTAIPINLTKTTAQEALDYVATITKSYVKVLSPNTVFIFNDNQNKRRDYEEMVTKVFYLQNVTQQSEMQDFQNILRTGCDIQRVFPFNAGWALVVRGEADRVELCSKLIRDVDKPRSEVLVDFLVMEASDTFNKQIAAAIASTGLNVPVSFVPRTTLQVQSSSSSTTSTTSSTSNSTSTGNTTGLTGTTNSNSTASSTNGFQIPLSQLHNLSGSDFATTLPGALLQAAMSDTRSKILQAPQIRCVDNVKATMNVGERVPVASGSFQPGIGGVGINPLVNTQFNYQDVGVNVEMSARVLERNEVYMHVKIDISDIDGYQTQSGIQEPIIGQRKVEEEIRVKEGEVALIGGVIKQQEDYTVTGIPGLMKIPLIGNLFKGNQSDHSRDDLMIVLIPHIMRRPDYTPDNLRAIATGTQTITLHYGPAKPDELNPGSQIQGSLSYEPAPPGGTTTPAPPAGVPAAAPPPTSTTTSVAPPAAAPPAMAPPATAPPATAPPARIPAAAAPPAAAPPATAPPLNTPPATVPAAAPAASSSATEGGRAPDATRGVKIRFNPSQMESRINSTISIAVVIEGGSDIVAAPMTIRYDSKMLRLDDVTAGDFMAADGQTPVLNKNIQQDLGQAQIVLNRIPGTAGVSGPAGVLLNLKFQAIGRGPTKVSIPTIAVRNSQGQTLATGNPEFTVRIQ